MRVMEERLSSYPSLREATGSNKSIITPDPKSRPLTVSDGTLATALITLPFAFVTNIVVLVIAPFSHFHFGFSAAQF